MSDYINVPTMGVALIALPFLYVIYKFVPFFLGQFTSPLRFLPGPPSDHWLYGNTRPMMNAENSTCQEAWIAQYGPTISYKSFFGIYTLFTMDTRALNYVLTHADDYQKSPQSRFQLARAVGPGVLVTEEQQHRQQRRILNPAFGPAHIRELTSIFIEKSQTLRDLWSAEIANSKTTHARIDVLFWLNKVTLDIIGLAGFNYDFHALNPESKQSELNQAFHVVTSSRPSPLLRLLQGFFPPARLIKPALLRKIEDAQQTMRRIGTELIAEKKAAILANSQSGNGVEKRDVTGRDLLTLLIKANMAKDVPESQRLTDEEVLAQVPTFIVAGHETTATATMWTLFSLTQHSDVQNKLRQELFTLDTDAPTMDELSSLPYFDMVVKEALRFHSPVPMTTRVAMHDDVIPLSSPVIDTNGVKLESVHIQKGDLVVIPIKAINRYKGLWGDDAHDFKPERWEHPPEAISNIPGVWGHILSFLGGPRSCIGYRFSIIETKALLFTLIRAFEFELAISPDKVTKRSVIVQRPVILGEGKNSVQMPLIVRPYVRSSGSKLDTWTSFKF